MRKVFVHDEKKVIQGILDSLTLRDGEFSGYLMTKTREEYDRLLRAALAGRMPARVSLGRSG